MTLSHFHLFTFKSKEPEVIMEKDEGKSNWKEYINGIFELDQQCNFCSSTVKILIICIGKHVVDSDNMLYKTNKSF